MYQYNSLRVVIFYTCIGVCSADAAARCVCGRTSAVCVFTDSAAAQTLRSYDVSARFNKSALSLDHEALPAFAAERRAAAPCCSAPAAVN